MKNVRYTNRLMGLKGLNNGLDCVFPVLSQIVPSFVFVSPPVSLTLVPDQHHRLDVPWGSVGRAQLPSADYHHHSLVPPAYIHT